MKKKKIVYEGGEILFSISKNRLSKRLRLSVNSDGEVKVTIPKWLPEKLAENFILDKVDWIIERLQKFQKETNPLLRLSSNDYKKHKEKARIFVAERIKQINQTYGYKIGKISIRNQKTRWGSCSGRGNLNFNYKIIFLPDKIADYIIAHEICHIKEMNHSQKFWDLVSLTVPSYIKTRKELKKYKI
ncbi:MAG: SprT family zinc-dependent metalloprotease [Candidatus Paceibacterota bacterium]